MKKVKAIKFRSLFILSCVVFFVSAGIITHKVFASANYVVDKNINLMMEDINILIQDKDQSMLSSNPYDYIIDNTHYQDLVSGGIKVLPSIVNNIKSSTENGLEEFILAIAAEEITSTQLKNQTGNWSNAKEWIDNWNKFLRNIPVQVSYIASDTESALEVKQAGLEQIGIMALPYIKDEIDNGHVELQDTYDSLNNTLQSYESFQISYNNSDEDIIRSMVEEVRVD